MPLPRSASLRRALSEAEDIASATDQRLGTGHILLAFFTVPNEAARFLVSHGIDEDRVLEAVEGSLSEPPHALRAALERAERTAGGCGALEVQCLHLLVAITRDRSASAATLLEKIHADVRALRTHALSELTVIGARWSRADEALVTEPKPRNKRALHSELPMPGRSAALHWTPPLIIDSDPKRRPRRTKAPVLPDRPSRARIEPSALFERDAASVLPLPAPLPVPTEVDSRPPDGAERFRLRKEDYPWLTSLGRNLSEEAALGRLDSLVGREAELEQLVDILGKRRSNNPCLLGEPGVGKTALVEALAALLSRSNDARIADRIIVELDVGALLIGTHLRGSFSEKLAGLREEVERAGGRVVIFFDELHTLIGAGSSGDGALDAAQELKAALARGTFPCIGATTPREWSEHIAPDAALARRFEPVLIEEPSPERATAMLSHVIERYALHHRVEFSPAVVEAAVQLSARFLVERHLPDKAIALLDLAGSRAARAGRDQVTIEDVARLIGERVGLQTERVLSSDRERLLKLERLLEHEIVGHRPVLSVIAEVVRRHAVGFGSQRPRGSFLFLGPTGVGKTETAKALARVLHGSEDALLTVDLSEYGEAHAVARIVGAPPGYVGFDAGGQLTERVRQRPGCVLLLDEVEKAHPEVLQLFLQVLDEGRLTDGRGRSVSFTETIVVMTSNLGAETTRAQRPIGFQRGASAELDAIREQAQRALAPELWSRIDEKLVFGPLDGDEIRAIARKLAESSSRRLGKERGISFELTDLALDYVVQQGGFDLRQGARPMRQLIARLIEGPIATRILEGRLHADEHVRVTTRGDGTLAFLVGDDHTSLSQRPGLG